MYCSSTTLVLFFYCLYSINIVYLELNSYFYPCGEPEEAKRIV